VRHEGRGDRDVGWLMRLMDADDGCGMRGSGFGMVDVA